MKWWWCNQWPKTQHTAKYWTCLRPICCNAWDNNYNIIAYIISVQFAFQFQFTRSFSFSVSKTWNLHIENDHTIRVSPPWEVNLLSRMAFFFQVYTNIDCWSGSASNMLLVLLAFLFEKKKRKSKSISSRTHTHSMIWSHSQREEEVKTLAAKKKE